MTTPGNLSAGCSDPSLLFTSSPLLSFSGPQCTAGHPWSQPVQQGSKNRCHLLLPDWGAAMSHQGASEGWNCHRWGDGCRSQGQKQFRWTQPAAELCRTWCVSGAQNPDVGNSSCPGIHTCHRGAFPQGMCHQTVPVWPNWSSVLPLPAHLHQSSHDCRFAGESRQSSQCGILNSTCGAKQDCAQRGILDFWIRLLTCALTSR